MSTIVAPFGLLNRQLSPLASISQVKQSEEEAIVTVHPKKTSRSLSVVAPPRFGREEGPIISPYPDFQPPEGVPPLFEMTQRRKSSLPMAYAERERKETEVKLRNTFFHNLQKNSKIWISRAYFLYHNRILGFQTNNSEIACRDDHRRNGRRRRRKFQRCPRRRHRSRRVIR